MRRASLALSLIASAMSEAPWVDMLLIEWKPASASATPYKGDSLRVFATPAQSPAFDDPYAGRRAIELSALLELALATQSALRGEIKTEEQNAVMVEPSEEHLLRQHLKFQAFANACPGFNLDSADRFQRAIKLAESELKKALSCAAQLSPSWAPSGSLDGSWSRVAKRQRSLEPKRLAEALEFNQLGALIEKEALDLSAQSASPGASRKQSL